jgi:hypothetical protein
MKRFTSHWLAACLGLALAGWCLAATGPSKHSGLPSKPDVIGRIHSVGQAQWSRDGNGRVFQEIWKLPATVRLRDEALDKLAGAVAANFEAKAQGNEASCAPLIRPLLNDLCSAEFYAEAVEHPQDMLESTLALHLNEERSRLWQTNWARLLKDWKLRSKTGSAHLSVLSTNSWVALRCISGPGEADAEKLSPNALLTSLRQGKRPVPASQEYWFKVDADLPRWSQWLSLRKPDLPRVTYQVAGRKEYLRSQARLTFREPVVPRIEKWDVPMAILRDPLISFTAVQGLAPWLKKQPFIQELGLEKTPNQLYLWALSQTAFQLQAAVPLPDANLAFQRIGEKWVPRFNKTFEQYAVGQIRPLTNRVELMWRGLPILVPYLNPVQQDGKGYIHAGIFPVNAPTNPPPRQLFEQLTTQTNLIYYDWEITQARVNQLRPLVQLAAVFMKVSPMSTNSASYSFLDAVEPHLGNSITEVSVASPRELEVVRTSHLGMNGIEILAMAQWLQSTNFPAMNFDVGFRPVFRPGSKKPAR